MHPGKVLRPRPKTSGLIVEKNRENQPGHGARESQLAVAARLPLAKRPLAKRLVSIGPTLKVASLAI